MVRSIKSLPSKSASTVASVAPIILNVEVTSVKVDKVKKVKASKVEAPVVASDVAVVAVVPSDPVEANTTISCKLNEFNGKLQQLVAMLGLVKTEFKGLEKTVNREMKAQSKASAKKSKRSGNRQPSGFVRPTLISDELATFLGKVPGTEMARTDVSKEINIYICNHNLKDAKNGRQINADEKLSALLNLKADDVLTYFNLQRHIKHHFIKVVAPIVVDAAPVIDVVV